mmetsp:Transcript_113549/g.315913  ORF Transcript_113549/g.315913 Transcript_113549/m.315913 type:complete len:248 (+) Transcript_113549:213-956(+)
MLRRLASTSRGKSNGSGSSARWVRSAPGMATFKEPSFATKTRTHGGLAATSSTLPPIRGGGPSGGGGGASIAGGQGGDGVGDGGVAGREGAASSLGTSAASAMGRSARNNGIVLRRRLQKTITTRQRHMAIQVESSTGTKINHDPLAASIFGAAPDSMPRTAVVALGAAMTVLLHDPKAMSGLPSKAAAMASHVRFSATPETVTLTARVAGGAATCRRRPPAAAQPSGTPASSANLRRSCAMLPTCA